MPADQLIAATSLDAVDGSGRTLRAVVLLGRGNSGAALGSGAFATITAYRYHGAPVAVKELKAGADEESIGALFEGFVWFVSPRRLRVFRATLGCRAAASHILL